MRLLARTVALLTARSYFLGTRMTRKQFDAKKIANREKGAKMTRDKATGSASSEDELLEHVKQE